MVQSPERKSDPITVLNELNYLDRSPKSKWPEIARTTVNTMTKATSDIESLVMVATVGYTHLYTGYKNHDKDRRRVGEDVIQRLEQYLSENLVARHLLTNNTQPEKSRSTLLKQIDAIISTYWTNPAIKLTDQSPVIRFLNQLKPHLDAPSIDARTEVVIDVQDASAKARNQSVDQFLTHSNASRETSSDITDPTHSADLLRNHFARVLNSKSSEANLTDVQQFEAFAHKNFDNINFHQAMNAFLNLPIPSTKAELFDPRILPETEKNAKTVLRYLAHSPQNNVLWSNYLTDIFFNESLEFYTPESLASIEQYSQEDQVEYLQPLRALREFHTWFAKKLFISPIQPDLVPPDPEFDQLIQRLQDDYLINIFHQAYIISTRGALIDDDMAGGKEKDQFRKNSPFTKLYIDVIADHLNYSMTYEELMHQLISQQSPKLKDFWNQRFGKAGEKVGFIFDTTLSSDDILKERSTEFITNIKNNLGVEFLNNLDQKGTNLNLVTKQILENSTSPKRTSVRFASNSLPAIMGFTEITFKNSTSNEVFPFQLKGHEPPIDGIVQIDTGEIALSIDLEETNRGLENIIKNIIASYLVAPGISNPFGSESQSSASSNSSDEVALSQPYLTPASPEFQSKYQIGQPADIDPEEVTVLSEKVENLERKMQFAKGEVFEQLVGTVLSYTRPDELVLPQYCLDVHQDGNKVIYGDRIDFRVGIELFEVKWGYHTENINKTTEKQISLLSKQPQNNKFLYHLVRMEETGEPNKPLQLMNQMFRENMLTHSVQDYEAQDLFETITLAVMELSSSRNNTQNIENIQLLRNYLYNQISEANLLTGQERQTKIRQDLSRLATIITQPDSNKAFDDLNSYLLTGNNEAYSPNEATFEWKGVLYTKKIGGNGGHSDVDQPIDKEPSAKPMRARGYRGMYSPRLRGIETYLPIYVQKVEEYNSATDDRKADLFQQLVQLKTHFHQPEEAKVLSNEKLPESVKLQPVLGSEGQPIVDPRTGRFLYTKTWVEPHFIPALTREEKDDIQVIYENRFANSSPLVLQDYLKSWIFPEAI